MFSSLSGVFAYICEFNGGVHLCLPVLAGCSPIFLSLTGVFTYVLQFERGVRLYF